MDKDEMVSDRAYDEAIPVETDDEEEVSSPASSEAGSPTAGKSSSGNQQSPHKSAAAAPTGAIMSNFSGPFNLHCPPQASPLKIKAMMPKITATFPYAAP
mmetsp:Transcript_148066/g.283742  ORF Transcript_148066/g.283742 Transcript_148066/m.283742 type:complete len:100 (+) Transcript_148066:121-420(+)